jgi:hypothetical protein
MRDALMAQGGDPSKDKRQEKEAALAAALRSNLRRRKAGGAKPEPPKASPRGKPGKGP